MVGSSSSRMSDACARAPAMITRCFSPPLSVANDRDSSAAVPVARNASRAISRSRRSLELERSKMRIAAHQHHVDHAEVERRLRFLRHDAPRAAPAPAAACRATGSAVEQHAARVGAQHAGDDSHQRRLARSIRAEQADDACRGRRRIDTSSQHVARRARVHVVVRERDVTSLCSIVHRHIERPAAGSLNVSALAQSKRRGEERRVGHDRVILAAFTARIDAKPCELRAAARDRSGRPSQVSSKNSHRAVTINASAPEAIHSSNRAFGRAAKQRLDRGQAVRRAHPLGPLAMFVEQNVTEHTCSDPVSGERGQRLRRTPRRRSATCSDR